MLISKFTESYYICTLNHERDATEVTVTSDIKTGNIFSFSKFSTAYSYDFRQIVLHLNFLLKPWWPPFLASGHHFILSRGGHFHLPGVTIKWKFSPWVDFIYYTCSVGHTTACFPQKSNLYTGNTTAKVWLLLPCEFTRPLSLSHLSGLYREQSANKINCLEEQPISVPSMSVKGKGRLITCAKEQFWALRPNTALFMCWENSLGCKRGDCPQTTSGECSLQHFISCTLRSTWEECQLASAKIMPGTVLTLHKYIYHSASVTTECANKGVAYFSLQFLALHLLRTRQKWAHHKRAERRGPKKGLQEEAAAMGSRIIHQSSWSWQDGYPGAPINGPRLYSKNDFKISCI